MKLADVRAVLTNSVFLLGFLWLTEGFVATASAQAVTAAEREQKRVYDQMDGAYGREHPRTPASLAAGSDPSTLTRPGQRLQVNYVAGYGPSTRIDNPEWVENRRCNFAGHENVFFDNTRYLTPDQIIKAIQRSDIFLFSGHAGQASSLPGQHVLVGSPPGRAGWLTSVDLGRSMQGRQGPRLVIVNGCITTNLKDGVPQPMRMSTAFGITDQTVGRAYLGWPASIPGFLADDQIGRLLTTWTTPGADGKFPTLDEARVKRRIDELTIVGDRNLRYKPPEPAASATPSPAASGAPAPEGTYRIVAGCADPSAPSTDLLVRALNSLPQCPGMQLGPACFQKFTVRKDGLAATTFLAREPAAGSERTDLRAVGWLDAATATRSFKSTFDRFKTRKPHQQWKFESFAVAGRPDTGALEVWLDSQFGGEVKEAGRANGVLICGNVESNLTMFISAKHSGHNGKALVDATQAQMKALLQQIGNAVRASGACGAS